MPSIDFPLDDKTIRMPNGANLIIVDGTIEVGYSMQPAEPDVGIFRRYVDDYWVEGPFIELKATDEDGEREVCLCLPAQHPSIRDLCQRCHDAIVEDCAEDDRSDW